MSFARKHARLALLAGGIFYLLTAAPLHAAVATTSSEMSVEQSVRSFFKDTPVMIEIARCESKFRQFADSGNVLAGGYGNNMLGVFQFNKLVHLSAAADLGFDIATLAGNLGYAKHVYTLSGTDPWVSSFACWNTALLDTDDDSDEFTNLVFGQTHPDVQDLQQRLNAAGFVIAATGPGSVGNETNKFGSLTRTALRQFQCAAKIACSGDEYSTGYGLYNEATHEALLEYKKPKTVAKKSDDTELSAKKRSELLAQIQELTKLVVALQQKLALLRNA